jgi:hypothetical protein
MRKVEEDRLRRNWEFLEPVLDQVAEAKRVKILASDSANCACGARNRMCAKKKTGLVGPASFGAERCGYIAGRG